jgi:hypothetical protein
MSKYFGEFLVEKGVITKDNLVDALVDQISNTPPLCQIVFENKIISPTKLFDVFRYQQDNQSEFVSACKATGVWTQEVEDKINSYLDELRRPLGHILVNKGVIDLKKLTNMLDEFLSQLVIAPPRPAPAPLAVIKAEEVSLPSSLPSGVISLEELTETIQPGILSELDETFDEKKKKMIRVALSLIKDNVDVDSEICKKLLQDITKILNNLNNQLGMLALDKLTELLSLMELSVSKLNAEFANRPKDSILSSLSELTKSIDLAWALKASIMTNSTERSFFLESKTSQQFQEQMSSLKRS